MKSVKKMERSSAESRAVQPCVWCDVQVYITAFEVEKSSDVVEETDSSCRAPGPEERSQSSRGSNTCQMQRDVSG